MNLQVVYPLVHEIRRLPSYDIVRSSLSANLIPSESLKIFRFTKWDSIWILIFRCRTLALRQSAHPDFPAAWLAFCAMRAVSSLLMEDSTDIAVAAKIIEIAIEAAVSDEEKDIIRRAFDETEEVFQSFVKPVFQAQLARFKGEDPETQSLREEIQRQLDDVMNPVARFMVLAEEGWGWSQD